MYKRNRSSSPNSSAAKKTKNSTAEGTLILHLNDDCLRVVFSYLDHQDMCHVKETCYRFELLADEAFRRKYSRCCKFKYSLGLCNYSEFANSKTLRLFGKLIHTLYVKGIRRVNATQYWREIVENCNQLKKLSVSKCYLSGFQLFPHAKSQVLEHLVLMSCWGNDEDYTRIVTFFTKVKKLEVWDSVQALDGTFLARSFQRLRTITLQYVSSNESLDKFIRLNPRIEDFFVENLKKDQVDTIAKHLDNIKSLSILCDATSRNFPKKIGRLGRLAKLKKLQFNYCGRPIVAAIEKLAEKNLLELLGLTHGKLDMELCAALCKFSHLKTLKLVEFRDIHTNLLKELMSGLNLKSIYFIDCSDITHEAVVVAIKYSRSLERVFGNSFDYTLNDASYLQLVEARKESRTGVPLQLFVDFIRMSDSVQQIDGNSNFVQVKKWNPYLRNNNTIVCSCIE